MASWGANLILACREPPDWEQHPTIAVERCKEVAEKHGYSSMIEWWELDMADFSSVEGFCQRWLESGRVLDLLCNNAGTAYTAITKAKGVPMTKDGFQLIHQVFFIPRPGVTLIKQVNFLSHVLLTLHLLPSLARSAEPRIICTTSCLHHLGVFDLDHFDGNPGMKGGDYENNKLYYQMWIAELQSRFLKHPEYIHITINGVHPGLVASGIWNTVHGDDYGVFDRILGVYLWYLAVDSRQGSFAITHAATSSESGPDPERQNVGAPNGGGGGRYFNRIWEAPAMGYCNDREARSKLWMKLDEELRLREKGLLTVLGL